MQRNTLVFLLLTMLAAVFLVGCSTPGEPEELVYGGNTQPDDEPFEPTVSIGLDVGDEAPNFTLADTYGDELVLSELRGQSVLLFFWATGCPYCEEQYPRMQAFHDTYSDSLSVISINLGDDPQLINAYMAERDLTFPCLVADVATQTAYEAYSVPMAVLLDSDGVVAFNDHPAYLTEPAVQEEF